MNPSTASVSTHILDTAVGRPASGVTVLLSVRRGGATEWTGQGGSRTDADGRCKDLPALPAGTAEVRLEFAVGPYLAGQHRGDGAAGAERAGGARAFFPEVTVTFAVEPGEHYHVPLLLSPFGYSVYRGS
ncbi:hydroxyisourate hydrolase [Streptomyces sp. TP-A0874]|uniref:hydroxyisourate hydrolase n=1 Tax=Streptomyces sp. TP-A0874 TaxID=549819 RepID=UPI000853AE0C|nr:hydroxyisourate hydrolase [Streptomyces sp. TP-A0874]